MTNDDKQIGSIGDVNPIEYGGGPVFRNSYNGFGLEYYCGLDYSPTGKVIVYQADVCIDAKDWLATYDWVNLTEISTYTGQSVESFKRSLDTPIGRALACQSVGHYYGWDNLDSYPLELTVADLAERWGYDPEDYVF